MPDYRRAHCRNCGGHRDAVGSISWAGLCAHCGEARFLANCRQLRSHSGPFAVAHRRALVASFGGVLLDDVREQP